MPLKTIKLEKITIQERYRTDLGDIDLLVESIKDKGILQPITVDSDFNLLAGGRRLEACKRAEMDKIPCNIISITGEVDAREIELIENVVRKDMNWAERAALVKRITDLEEEKNGVGAQGRTAKILDKGNGWVSRQLQLAQAIESVPELANMKTEDDVFKSLNKMEEEIVVNELVKRQKEVIKTAHNDDYLSIANGNYQVGDAFIGMTGIIDMIEKKQTSVKYSIIEVDPPYGIDLGETKKGEASAELDRYTEVDKDDYTDFLADLCNNLYKIAAPDAWVIFWYGPTWHTEVFNALRNAGFDVDDIPGIWDKGAGQTMQPDLYLARCYEPFAIARKGKPSIKKRGRSNVFQFPPVIPSEKTHPTQRPIRLMQEILSTFAFPGSTLLVPFLGSGVTLRAAYWQNMVGTGWDLDEKNKDRFLLTVENDIANGLYGGKEDD